MYAEFLSLMLLTLAVALFGLWRSFEQDKREKLEGKKVQHLKNPPVLL